MVARTALEIGQAASHDPESRAWLEQLRGRGPVYEATAARLHGLLLRMAYARLLPRREHLPSHAVEELAVEAADQALVAVLRHLDDFRGASRFTTWACQFAVTEVAVALRRYRRQRRELPVEPQLLVLLCGSGSSSLERDLEQIESLRLVCAAINDALTARQREVLLALAVNGESPLVLAASLGTNPGAVYKTLHDARRKLKARLAGCGVTPFGDGHAERGKNSGLPDSYAVEAMGAVT